ncbi:AIR synthase-related protein, partial [Planctomycetota bacterium]
EVQGGSIIKPLQGIHADGPGDGAVITPVLGGKHAIAVGCGINPAYSDIDPYNMAMSVIDEALRNVVAVGGNPDHTAILDNFAWGNTDKPENLGALVRACQGCYDAAIGLGTPFISGKDSLNNEYKTEQGTIVIPHTLLVTAVSVLTDYQRTCTMDLKYPGSTLYLLGLTRNELGASRYYAMHGVVGANVPAVDTKKSLATMRAIYKAIQRGLAAAVHDLSEGGLGVALAEMAFAGGLGLEVHLKEVPVGESLTNEQIMFSESNSRFLVEVKPEDEAAFESLVPDVCCAKIGRSNNLDQLTIYDLENQLASEIDIWKLKTNWLRPINW